jgi:type II secretory pathway component PulK
MKQGAVRQRGVALAMVVWFIAGMTLLVAGIVALARQDTRMTQLHIARAEVVAAGDGAINLAMVARLQGYQSSGSGPLISETVQTLGEHSVTVRLYPANGFVDPNVASVEVLTVLFQVAGSVDPLDAQRLADNVVQWRNPSAENRRSRRQRRQFDAPADLLRVEGVTRRLLDGIRDYIVVGDWAVGSLNWSASPQRVMALLEQLDPGQVDAVAGRRQNLLRTGEENYGQRQGSRADGVSVYRADALVTYGGRTWLRRQWLTSGSSRSSALPWQTVRTEPPRVVQR